MKSRHMTKAKKKEEPTILPDNYSGIMYNPTEERFELLIPKDMPEPTPTHVIFMTGLLLKLRDPKWIEDITEWAYSEMDKAYASKLN